MPSAIAGAEEAVVDVRRYRQDGENEEEEKKVGYERRKGGKQCQAGG